jgi:hypothetical protein
MNINKKKTKKKKELVETAMSILWDKNMVSSITFHIILRITRKRDGEAELRMKKVCENRKHSGVKIEIQCNCLSVLLAI